MDAASQIEGGQGFSHCEGPFHIVQYFGNLGDAAIPSTFPLIDQLRNDRWDAADKNNRLWRIVSTVREQQRTAAAPVESIQPGQIEALGSNRTALKMHISVTEMGFDPRAYVIDWGFPIEVWGKSVTVRWVSPATVNEVTQVASAVGTVLDGLIGAHVIGIETPLGHKAPLTDYRRMAINEVVAFRIPRGAENVTVYQRSGFGTPSTTWRWTYGDPAAVTAWELGALTFIDPAATTLRTHTESVVPGATHLVSDAANASERFYTLVWTIRP